MAASGPNIRRPRALAGNPRERMRCTDVAHARRGRQLKEAGSARSFTRLRSRRETKATYFRFRQGPEVSVSRVKRLGLRGRAGPGRCGGPGRWAGRCRVRLSRSPAGRGAEAGAWLCGWTTVCEGPEHRPPAAGRAAAPPKPGEADGGAAPPSRYPGCLETSRPVRRWDGILGPHRFGNSDAFNKWFLSA